MGDQTLDAANNYPLLIDLKHMDDLQTSSEKNIFVPQIEENKRFAYSFSSH